MAKDLGLINVNGGAQGADASDTATGADGYRYRYTGAVWEKLNGPSQPNTTPEGFIAQLQTQLSAQMDEMTKRIKDYQAANPFSFDEALATASAKERYNPYYDAQLSDYLKGVQTQTSTIQGQQSLLTELNRVQAGADARNLQTAIDKTQQGYSDAGLFFSGANNKDVGNQNIAGNEQNITREANYNQSQLGLGNELTDIANKQATFQRENTAAQQTALTTDVSNQKTEAQNAYGASEMAYLGYPYSDTTSAAGTTGNASLDSLIQGAFS